MSISRRQLVLSAAAIVGVALGCAGAVAQTPSPAGATVYFINIKDGDTVSSPFKVQFGLTGMGVAPVGVTVDRTGHHHLVIDKRMSAEDLRRPVPVDTQHMHFGGGQTEVMVTLPAGQHTLQLVLGDHTHTPHNPPVTSPVITITVR
jgi:Domain of unknown function (DUF4399)